MSYLRGGRVGDTPGAPIRLLLADDENLFRDALAMLLGLQDDLEVVAQAASGPEAVAMARATDPDVAVLDLQMPGADGIDVARELLANPEAPNRPGCLVVTSHGRPGYLKRALEVGVRGFLPKTASGSVLAEAVRTVHRGGRYIDPELAADAIAAGASPLSAREADVLELAADGAGAEDQKGFHGAGGGRTGKRIGRGAVWHRPGKSSVAAGQAHFQL